MKNKKMMTVVIIIVCIALVYGVKIFLQSSKKGASSTQSFRVKGATLAPIQITEFIDFLMYRLDYLAVYRAKSLLLFN
mgnify:CR=1 FL=1